MPPSTTTAEPGNGAVVRISRAGPAPDDDPKERIAEEGGDPRRISTIGWFRSHPSQVAATELREGRRSLVAPNPPTEVADAIRARVAASCVARPRDFDVVTDDAEALDNMDLEQARAPVRKLRAFKPKTPRPKPHIGIGAIGS